jgi:hypothetical protein
MSIVDLNYFRSLDIKKIIYNDNVYQTDDEISYFANYYRSERGHVIYKIDVYSEFLRYKNVQMKNVVLQVIDNPYIDWSDWLVFREQSVIIDGDFTNYNFFRLRIADNAIIKNGIFMYMDATNNAVIDGGIFKRDVNCGANEEYSHVKINDGVFFGYVKLYNGATINGGIYKNNVFCDKHSRIVNGRFYGEIVFDGDISDMDEDMLVFLKESKNYGAWRKIILTDNTKLTPRSIA